MSLFGRLLEARGVSYQDVWGRGGPAVSASSEAQALRLPAVFAAVQLLANGIASLPLHEYRELPTADDGQRNLVRVDDPGALLRKPSDIGTVFDWKFQAVSSLALRGNAYGLPTQRDWLGRITRCEWLHPDDVELDGEDDVLSWRGRARRWLVDGRPVDELVHVRNFVLPGRVLGLSPIAAFRTLIEAGLNAQKYGRDWFVNGAVPSAVLETDQAVRSADAAAIKARVVEGAKDRQPIVLGRGVSYKSISVAPEEAQFLQTIRATATTIASIFGVPAEEIGGETGGSLTYNTDETRARKVQRVALRPYMARLEEAVSELRPRGRVVRFNADANLRAETLSRYQAHSYALRDGWMNRDEVRAIEDLPPIPDGEGQEFVVARPTAGEGGEAAPLPQVEGIDP